MTRQVSLRQISGPLLLAAVFLQLTIDLHVPGAALAIVRRGEVIFARGFGVADVENKTPVTPRTAFYTAVRVVRAGELDGRKIYVIRLESDGLAPTMVSVEAETGDVLQD